jgi:hydrogenase 3 maturation protease
MHTHSTTTKPLTTEYIIVALGNEFRGDDGAGMVFGRLLHERGIAPVIEAGSTPENEIARIISYRANTVVFVDAIDFGGIPGEWTAVSGDRATNLTISTHASLRLLLDLITRSTGSDVLILGIQPKSLAMNTELSPEVRDSIQAAVRSVILATAPLKKPGDLIDAVMSKESHN